METMFIRHNFDATPEVLRQFWDQRWVGVHFKDIPSTNPEDYGSAGASALKLLWELCKSGAIVGAVYPGNQSSIIIGKIDPASKVQARQFGDRRIYKVVQLKDSKEVSYLDYPRLMVQPRQRTITRWRKAEAILDCALRGEGLPFDVHSLHPSQQEVMCYEYLREMGILSSLLMPIGRTLRSVDIWGLGPEGKEVLAQVTHSSDEKVIAEKIATLRSFAGGASALFFFGPESGKVGHHEVEYVSIEKVFDEMAADQNSSYYKMIARMLRHN